MFKTDDILSINNDLTGFVDTKLNNYNHFSEHGLRVVKLASELALEVDLSQDDIRQIIVGSFLHDIGKIFLSDEILNSPLKLTRDQRAEVINHTVLGHEYLKDVKGLDIAKDIILLHHERVDGTGYPNGLLKYDIPLHVRIVSICDSYDAMTSHRAYKPRPLTHNEAVQELRRNKGTQFDSELVDIFIKLFDRKLDSMINEMV